MAAARALIDPAPLPAPANRVLRFPLLFVTAIAAVSLVPYLLAYLWTPGGHHFTGFFFIADDATTYLAKMRQGAAGSWLWTDPYTSEPHGGVFLFGFYLLFGQIAALLHIPLIAAYHVARISGAVALIIALDRLCRRLLPTAIRRMAMVVVVLGSGFGFVVQALGNPSVAGGTLQAVDLHLPELSGWYSILAIPHFAWATALVIAALLGLLRLSDSLGLRPLIFTAVTLNALTAIHPQMIPVIGLIWCAYQGVLLTWGERPSFRSILGQAAAFAATAPLLAYNAWILFRDPTIAEWARQWRHQAPPLPSLAISLGLPLLGALYGIVLAWQRRDKGLALMMVWPPLVFALLYLPNVANIQRRLLDAIYVPMGILAVVGLRAMTARLSRKTRRRLEATLVTLACFSSAVVLAIALRFASGAFSEAYVTNDTWQAMAWLSSHHAASDRALASPGVGLLLPAWSGVQVYVGHYSETLDYFHKIRAIDAALASGSDTPSFLKTNGITLLYWGPDESGATTFDPTSQPYLSPIYHQGSISIYRVQT
jgi:hypothetical protein